MVRILSAIALVLLFNDSHGHSQGIDKNNLVSDSSILIFYNDVKDDYIVLYYSLEFGQDSTGITITHRRINHNIREVGNLISTAGNPFIRPEKADSLFNVVRSNYKVLRSFEIHRDSTVKEIVVALSSEPETFCRPRLNVTTELGFFLIYKAGSQVLITEESMCYPIVEKYVDQILGY